MTDSINALWVYNTQWDSNWTRSRLPKSTVYI